MRFGMKSRTTTHTVQNAIGGLVFGGLLLTNLLSLLLDLFPREEWIWFMSIRFHRVFGLLLDWPIFGGGQGPIVSLSILLLLCLATVICYMRRSWLGTAAVGHVALALCVVLAWGALRSAAVPMYSASLGPMVAYGIWDLNAVVFVALSLATFALCAINHIVFFRQRKR
jgi:hypothetical protein